ncbi:MAG: hypothetical protein AB9835_14550 [Eubacteriales bacterium]
MQDKNNDVVIINLDRPRQLWCGHKAMKTFSAMTGKNFGQIDTDDFGMEEIEKMMYCLLLKDAKDHGENLRIEDMEDLLDCVPFGELTVKMNAAFEAAFGGGKQEKNSQGIAAK